MSEECITSGLLPARMRGQAPHPFMAHSRDASAGSGGGPVRPSTAPPRSRRQERRFPAAQETQLWLQWWQDGEYLGRPARLVNVSRNGAMIVSWVLLRERQRLRVFLEHAPEPTGVNASVLGVVEAIKGMHQIRLEFVAPCTDAFIKAAAVGFEILARGQPPRSLTHTGSDPGTVAALFCLNQAR